MTLPEAMQILGLAPSAGEDALKRAYLRLLRKHHPERDKAGFLRLREAYELASRYAGAPRAPQPVEVRTPPAKPGPAPGGDGAADFEERWREAWEAARRGELQQAARSVRRLLGEPEALGLDPPPRQLLELLLDLHAAGFSEDAGLLYRATARWMEQTGRRPERGSEVQWRICGELTHVTPLRMPHALRRLMVQASRAEDPTQTQWAVRELALADPAAAKATLNDLARSAPTLHALFGEQMAPETPRDFWRRQASQRWKLAEQRIRDGSFRLASIMIATLLHEQLRPGITPIEPERVLDLLLLLHGEGWGAEAVDLLDAFVGWLDRTGRDPFAEGLLRRRWGVACELCRLDAASFPREVRSAIARAADAPGGANGELRDFAAANPRRAAVAWQMMALNASTLFEEYAGPLQTDWEDDALAAELPPVPVAPVEVPPAPQPLPSFEAAAARFPLGRLFDRVAEWCRRSPGQIIFGAFAVVLLLCGVVAASSGLKSTAELGAGEICDDASSVKATGDCGLATRLKQALGSADCARALPMVLELEARMEGEPIMGHPRNGLRLLRTAYVGVCLDAKRGENR
ncbi:MAG TPA: J domain-containing protein [Myxococcaceae bacterium]|jgi:hypothetical protein